MPPQGDEQKQNALGKRGSSSIGGSAGGSINNNQELQELLSLWLNLTEADQIELLAIARKRVIDHLANESPNLPQSN